jgi:hypothetical protein
MEPHATLGEIAAWSKKKSTFVRKITEGTFIPTVSIIADLMPYNVFN